MICAEVRSLSRINTLGRYEAEVIAPETMAGQGAQFSEDQRNCSWRTRRIRRPHVPDDAQDPILGYRASRPRSTANCPDPAMCGAMGNVARIDQRNEDVDVEQVCRGS